MRFGAGLMPRNMLHSRLAPSAHNCICVRIYKWVALFLKITMSPLVLCCGSGTGTIGSSSPQPCPPCATRNSSFPNPQMPPMRACSPRSHVDLHAACLNGVAYLINLFSDGGRRRRRVGLVLVRSTVDECSFGQLGVKKKKRRLDLEYSTCNV